MLLTKILWISLLIFCGCITSNPNRDPALISMMKDEGKDLSQIFLVSDYPLSHTTILWGDISEYRNELITINRSVKGNEIWTRTHVRHETFHALTQLQDGVIYLNGVRISDYVPAWNSRIFCWWHRINNERCFRRELYRR